MLDTIADNLALIMFVLDVLSSSSAAIRSHS